MTHTHTHWGQSLEEKAEPKEEVLRADTHWASWGHSGRRPGSKSFGQVLLTLEQKAFGMDIHDSILNSVEIGGLIITFQRSFQ